MLNYDDNMVISVIIMIFMRKTLNTELHNTQHNVIHMKKLFLLYNFNLRGWLNIIKLNSISM